MREEVLAEINAFRDATGLSESYLGKQAGIGTSFFESVRSGGATMRSVEKFRKFMSKWPTQGGTAAPANEPDAS